MRENILQKYGEERLPRYTSYPTAPNFSDQIGSNTYSDWLSNVPTGQVISLYLHIPFCRSMCWYCGCHTKVSLRDTPITDYLRTLHKEIDVVAATISQPLKVGHLHFGGGTPTIMGPSNFLKLMKHLSKNFDVGEITESAIEVDPRTLTAEMSAALGYAGINRVSLGVQSFDPVVQEAINRIQTIDQTYQAFSELQNAGIEQINFDLIYGLPHQTVASCIQTVGQALGMRPDRFSVFGYAHIPSFKKHQRLINDFTLPGGKERHEQAEAISETLVAAGYVRIGLDHFALPNDPLAIAQAKGRLHRNFQGYTTDNCQTLLGFGASSIGRFTEGFAQNEVELGRYASAIRQRKLATAKGYQFADDDLLRAEIIERLMCNFEVDIEKICTSHGVDSNAFLNDNERLDALVDDGLVTISGCKVTVKKEVRFVIRQVAACFDSYLGRAGRTHSKAA